MRKLIEIHQEYLIVCDNKQCDYKVKNETGIPNDEESDKFLNVPCPKCGENLLTEQDHLQSKVLMKGINRVNKYFSWLTIFIPKKAKTHKTTINVHNGINIKR